MKRISIDELKKIQLSILDEVDSFCKKNLINYSLSSGTLLGCIRHKGYIPWDDDIDICMLRPDYERFVKTFNQGSKFRRVISISNNEDYDLPYAKIEDPRTVIIENVDSVNNYGVNIDLFPIDGVPDSATDRRVYFRKLIGYYKLSMLKNVSIDWKNRNPFKNLILLVSKFFLHFTTMRCISQKLDATINKELCNSSHVCNLTCGNSESMRFPRECMMLYNDLDFEGNKYRVMNGYHQYLSISYGDYMKLPPLEQQKSHHAFSAWWKDS